MSIPCPRCSGRGYGSWKPEQGICYRCGGHKVVTVHPERHLRALHALRAKYLRLAHEFRLAEETGEFVAEAADALETCVQSGLRVRGDLEAAGVEVCKEDS